MLSQRRIGLTGGIASGKSSVGRWLAQQDIPVLDADQIARDALVTGSEGAKRVLEHFGDRVLASGSTMVEGRIDRAALGRIVFSDPDERRWLERLVHPLVRDHFDGELVRLEQEPIVVLMIPLLFEAGLESLCTEIWVVSCSEQQQQERLMARDALTAEEARLRIAAQLPLASKCARADLVIDNGDRPEAWIALVESQL
ncbi:dephospho-CoA kinase [Synechococcus sp. BS56D]|uniref:dephospho-CoA kinase n=1 Tax=Synechococcus sp. BS56D TaxID=2055944 RepID=UPI001038BEAA|nr:dephospho-CoA kinase [Synechococcus sp. BS56D]TCD58957.1 dephospho-CoA kinase [Synechococcus sp. BS56D]